MLIIKFTWRINDNSFHDGNLGGKKTSQWKSELLGASNFNRYDSHVLFFSKSNWSCMCFFSSQNSGTESGEVTGIFQHLKIQHYSSSNNLKHLKVSFIPIVKAVHLNMRPYLRIAKMATLIWQRNFNATPYDTHLGPGCFYYGSKLNQQLANSISQNPQESIREDLHP